VLRRLCSSATRKRAWLPAKTCLRQLYGLSHAEATLASRLLEGKDLKGVSEERAVSLATARTHLRNVFEKTGTKRQAELVNFFSEAPPPSG